jgi:hypothetical protein
MNLDQVPEGRKNVAHHDLVGWENRQKKREKAPPGTKQIRALPSECHAHSSARIEWYTRRLSWRS